MESPLEREPLKGCCTVHTEGSEGLFRIHPKTASHSAPFNSIQVIEYSFKGEGGVCFAIS